MMDSTAAPDAAYPDSAYDGVAPPLLATRRRALAGGAGWAAALGVALTGCNARAAGSGSDTRAAAAGAASPAVSPPGTPVAPSGTSAASASGTAATTTRTGTVAVPGAHLYYQLRGAGPLLLVVQGGAADAGATPELVERLASHYTVATYDRRGYSRSTLDGAPQKLQITTHSDDAHLLLAALTALGTTLRGPARLFGSSIGALIALDLTARYPERVRTLVAHEPPLVQLAPPDASFRALGGASAGGADPQAALQQFAGDLGIDPNDREPGVTPAPPSPYAAQNAEYFVDYDVQAAATYRADLTALKAVAAHIVPAAGSASRETQPYRAAAALAERLGSQLVEFPGSHAGYAQRPRAFAALLRDVFGD